MAGVGELIGKLLVFLPGWALALIGVLVAAFALPGYRYSVRTRQIRERARRMVRAPDATRPALIDEALALTGGDATLLGLLAREARKRTQPELYRRALAALDAHPAGAGEAARIRAEVQREDAPPTTALQEALAVRTLHEGGAVDAARARLTAALARFPDDDGLRQLAAELPAASS